MARSTLSLGAALVAGALAVSGCRQRKNEYVAPPPPEVTVAAPVAGQVVSNLDYTGTTAGIEEVQIRARVKGFLEKIHFRPGSLVKAGDLLFTIDPREFKAKVDLASANESAAKAALRLAENELERVNQAFARTAANQIEVDQKTAARDEAKARVDQMAALLAEAALDLEYTEVRTPVSGRVGRNLLDLGGLVGGSEPTLLTTVANDSQIHAYFNLSESDLLEKIRERGGRSNTNPPPIKVFLGMIDEEGYPHEGVVDYSNNTVDKETGTISVRAIFDNPQRMMLPGLFVRLRAPGDAVPALLVPDTAIGQDQQGRFVLVVGADNVVERRTVRVGPVQDRKRPVLSGLEAAERIVVNGMQRARPGAKVTPRDAAPAGAAPTKAER